MLLIATAIAMVAYPRDDEQAVIAACERRMASAAVPDGPARVMRVADAGLCYDGNIDAGGARAFAAALAAVPPDAMPIVVIRSRGGDVEAGLAMGEAVLARRATVVAHRFCGSSCANYVLAGAARRIVRHAAVLAFHGGATAMPESHLMAVLKAQDAPDPASTARRLQARLGAVVARQTRFLRRAGIDPRLFDWMERFNQLPDRQKQRLCSDAASFFVFSPGFLHRYRYDFVTSAGPRSTNSMRAALRRNEAPTDLGCYVGRQ